MNIKTVKNLVISTMLVTGLVSCYSPVEKDYDKNKVKSEYMRDHSGWIAEEDKEKGKVARTYEQLKNRDIIDPKIGMNRQEYYDEFHKQKIFEDKEDKPSLGLPDVSGLLMDPEAPILDNDKLVTLSVTEDIPLKDVLVELARRADIDIELDSGISGGVIFRAKDKPFSHVIDRVAALAKLRYRVEDGVLKVERDLPHVRNYRMNLLNMVRTSVGSTSVTSNISGEGTSGSELSSSAEQTDIWSAVEEGVATMIQTMAADDPAAGSDSSSGEQNNGGPTVISMNRQAGLISVYANDRQHREIKKYLDYVQISNSSQVLIEAKILEVALNDEYRSGIDWSFTDDTITTGLSIDTKFDKLGLDTAVNDQLVTIGVLPSRLFGLDNTSLGASVELVEAFGTSRTLSSPRIQAMNNQFAALTFAEDFVYFLLDIEEETDSDTGDTTLTINSELNTIPIGVILTLQPSIDLERNEIVMNVKPALSRVTSSVEDPGVALQAASLGITGISSTVPVVERRAVDSVVRIASGEVMVIGGLIEERSVNDDRGVPGLSKVPLLGKAFKSEIKDTAVVETVMFLKATIVPGKGVSVEDRDFYRTFTRDHQDLGI